MSNHSHWRAVLTALVLVAGSLGGAPADVRAQCPGGQPACVQILSINAPETCVNAGDVVLITVMAKNCSPHYGNMTFFVGDKVRVVENVPPDGTEGFTAMYAVPADCVGGGPQADGLSVPVTVELLVDDNCIVAQNASVDLDCCEGGGDQCMNVLVIDEEMIDNDIHSIEDAADACAGGVQADYLINDDRPSEVGNLPLRWNELCPGMTVTLPSGQLQDEGLFALPANLPWSLDAFVAGTVPQSQLDKIAGVRPLRTPELQQLVGRSFVGIVYDSDISMNYNPTNASLQGARLGAFYFTVLNVIPPGSIPESGSSSSQWDLVVRVDPVPTSAPCVQDPAIEFFDRAGGLNNNASVSGGSGQLELYKPSPNPFRSQTQFAFQVDGSDGQNVEIGVYDVAGRQVRKLASGVHAPGRYTARWDGRDEGGMPVKTGVYFVRAVVGEQKLSKSRIMYLR